MAHKLKRVIFVLCFCTDACFQETKLLFLKVFSVCSQCRLGMRILVWFIDNHFVSLIIILSVGVTDSKPAEILPKNVTAMVKWIGGKMIVAKSLTKPFYPLKKLRQVVLREINK